MWLHVFCVALFTFTLLSWLPTHLLLCFLVLIGLALVLTRPSVDALPTQQLGWLGRIATAFSGGGNEQPDVVDAWVVRVALHRERLFLGAFGKWWEIPKEWSRYLHFSDKLHESEPSLAKVISSEAEARNMQQRSDFIGAARAYASLDESRSGQLEMTVGKQTRYAQEAGENWLKAGRPDLAIPYLHRGMMETSDIFNRRHAAEMLAEATLGVSCAVSWQGLSASDADSYFVSAASELFKIAECEERETTPAMVSALTILQKAAEFRAQSGLKEAALKLLVLGVEHGIRIASDVGQCKVDWLRELDCCLWRRSLCTVLRDAGDVVGASEELDESLRAVPALVTGRGTAYIVDALRAAQDGDVPALEEASYELDQACGPLSEWQLESLLQMKRRLEDEDLT